MADTGHPIPGGRLPVRVWEVIAPQMALQLPALALLIAGAAVVAVLKSQAPSLDIVSWFETAPTVYIVTSVTGATYLIMLFVLWLLCRERGPATFAGYFGRFSPRQFWAGALVGVILAGAVTLALAQLADSHVIEFHSTPGEQAVLGARDPLQLALSLFVIGLIGPIAEEVYFRGLLLAWLRRGLWIPFAALADAIVFSALHFRNLFHPGVEGWVLSGVIAALGFLNAIFYLRTRSLWMPVATHMSYNATLVLLAYFG